MNWRFSSINDVKHMQAVGIQMVEGTATTDFILRVLYFTRSFGLISFFGGWRNQPEFENRLRTGNSFVFFQREDSMTEGRVKGFEWR